MNERHAETRMARKSRCRGRLSNRSNFRMISGAAGRRSLVSQAVAIYMEQTRETQKILNKVFKMPPVRNRVVRERTTQMASETKASKVDRSAQISDIPTPTAKRLRPLPLQPTSLSRPNFSIFPRVSYHSNSISFDHRPSMELISESQRPTEVTEPKAHLEQIQDTQQHQEVVQDECIVEQETQMTNGISHQNERCQVCPPDIIFEQNITSTPNSQLLSFRYEDEVGSFSMDSVKSSCEICCCIDNGQLIQGDFLMAPPRKSGSWSNDQSG